MYKYYPKEINSQNSKRNSKRNRRDVIPYAKSVLITGCDSGFGFLTSLALLAKGFRVVAACLTEIGCQKLLKSANNDPNIFPIMCDVTKSDMVDRLMGQLDEITQGRLWALIHNAGISLPGNVDFLPLEDYRKVMEVNYFAAVNFTQRCLPMLKESRGRIIFVSSTCGIVAMPNNSPYNASKYALEGFNDTLRQDLSLWGIKTIIIEPATMKTPVVEQYYKIMHAKFRAAPENIQKSYGKENFAKQISHSEKLIRKLSQNPQLVVNDICHAVMKKNPKRRYRPGIYSKFVFSPLRIMPAFYKDGVLNMMNKFPKPNALKNRGDRVFEFSYTYQKPQKQLWSECVDYLWKNGAGSKLPIDIEEEGDETGKGFTRYIKTFGKHGIREKLIDTEYPNRIHYKVLNPSWTTFPVTYHRGEISFVAEGPAQCTIVWKIEATPKIGAGMVVSLIFNYIISGYLKKLNEYSPPST